MISRLYQAKVRESVQGVNSDFLEILRTPDDITADAIPETFIHLDLQTENMVPCFLRSEISKLNHKDLYLDGTFSLVRNLDYSQIYIVSIVYSHDGSAVFSYPVLFFLMKKRTKKDYISNCVDYSNSSFFSTSNHFWGGLEHDWVCKLKLWFWLRNWFRLGILNFNLLSVYLSICILSD